MGDGSGMDGGAGAAPPPGADLGRVLDALRRGVDPGVFRGVRPVVAPEVAPEVAPVVPAEVPAGEPGAPEGARGGARGGAPEPREPLPVDGPQHRGHPGGFDVSALLPRYGVARLAQRVDVSAWGPRFWARLEDLRRHRPPNWPDGPGDGDGDGAAGVDPAAVERVTTGDGVPVVAVPRAAVVAALLAARDRPERVAVLLAHEADVLQDCRAVLREVAHPSLAGPRWLTGRALDALDGGHPEAARALAVSVADAAVTGSLRGARAQVKQQALLDPDLAAYTGPRVRAGLAPLLATSPGTDRDGASRGDAVGAGRGEAVVAVAVATSVLRALQELQDLAECARGPGAAP